MSVGRTIKHKTQVLKGLVTQGIGRTTRNRRLQRRGRTDPLSGHLKQSGDNTKDGFKHGRRHTGPVPPRVGTARQASALKEP
jgi:uncharacterized protein YjbJ (UPF0337 family)